MAALMIINYDVTDRAALTTYRQAAGAALIGPDLGSVVAKTDATLDLGEGEAAGTDTVVLRFPSLAAARSAYESEAYQAVLGDRLHATQPRFSIIVETAEP